MFKQLLKITMVLLSILAFPSALLARTDISGVEISDQMGSVDGRDSKGFTGLHYAAFDNNLSLANFLVSNGANVNIQSIEGYTPLHTAEYANNMNFAKFLIERVGANPLIKDSKGKTALDYAEKKGNRQMIELLKKASSDFMNKNKIENLGKVKRFSREKLRDDNPSSIREIKDRMENSADDFEPEIVDQYGAEGRRPDFKDPGNSSFRRR